MVIKNIKPYLPYLLAVGLFFAGRFTSPDNSKELTRKYELERKTLQLLIEQKEAKISDLSGAGLTIHKKMQEDSLKYSVSIKANNAAYLSLKKKYESINYSRASASELDSVRAVLLTLYSNK